MNDPDDDAAFFARAFVHGQEKLMEAMESRYPGYREFLKKWSQHCSHCGQRLPKSLAEDN